MELLYSKIQNPLEDETDYVQAKEQVRESHSYHYIEN